MGTTKEKDDPPFTGWGGATAVIKQTSNKQVYRTKGFVDLKKGELEKHNLPVRERDSHHIKLREKLTIGEENGG